MKKFFLFAAAAIAAMTVNAKVYNFAGITANQISTDGTIGTYVMDEVEIPSVSQPDGVDINVTLEGQEGLVINYTQSAGKSKDNILKFATNFMQADGKNVILTFSDVTVGDQIKLVVSAKGSTDAKFTALEGASGAEQTVTKIEKVEDFATVTFTATDSDVKIKEIGGGFRIVSATLEAGSGDDPGDDPVSGSFEGFSAESTSLGDQIAAGLAKDLVNVVFDETEAGKYSVNLVEGGVEGSFSFGGVVFAYKNSSAGATAYKTFGTYIQPNGKDREIRIPAKAGEKVRIVLTAACEGVLVDGESKDFVEGENILTATKDGIILKTASTKPKIQAIQPVGAQGVENIFEESSKAVKFIHNGQVVVKKGDRFYNLLGAEIAL